MKKQVILDRFDAALWAWWEGMNGKFGKWVLKPQYRRVWRWLTWGTFVILLFVFVFKPLMDWWDGVVNYLNYWRWGN